MKITLRYYQEDALKAIKDHLTIDGNDLVVLPTGAGKSIVIAKVSEHLNTDVLILQPSVEILEQNAEKLAKYVPREEIGIFSASCDSREVKKYTFAMIGSIHKKPELFKNFKVVIIDESHGVNPKDTGTMFIKFLKALGNPKVIGFTATPYRNMNGYHRIGNVLEVAVTLKLLCRIKPDFWKRIIYNINNAELTAKGFLCPLKYIDATLVKQSEIPLNKSQSDFDLEKYDKQIQKEEKHQRILRGIDWAEKNYKSVLVFCSSITQAQKYSDLTPNSACIHSKIPKSERKRIIEGFKNGEIKTVFNVGVLTTGFDHPALDCIILIRPTRSLLLYYQMLGRGVRIHPDKDHCMVIDFSGSLKAMGKISTIKLHKPYLWELETETGSWHNRPLYKYQLDLTPKLI